jgi:GTP pyrophosphokinase
MEMSYEIEFNNLVRQIKSYNPKLDENFLKSAFDFSYEVHKGQLRKSGDPYFQHCLEVAKILTNLRLDLTTIASGLLHDVIEDTASTLREIEEKFGPEVAVLVEGVTGIRRLQTINSKERPDENYIENYIKMLLAAVKDIRVILIKLADRLHNMRTLKHLPEKTQQEISRETRNIYVPLANRLGLAKIKTELEDLVFKFLDNAQYKELARKVNEKRQRREQYTQSLAGTIQKKLSDLGIRARVEGRPKSLYSIYKKSQNLNIAFEEIFDLFAIRIIVEKVEECYQAKDILHTQFIHRPDNFHDYIETPKPNGYQSLHTVIFSNENRLVEVQIRTEEMHKIAEDGIAAHWKYKEGKVEDSQLDKYLVDFRQWLRQLAEWMQDAKDEPDEVLEHLKINEFKDEIFVYTPKGELRKLPAESTPIDFAFAVHSDIGLQCVGAKVNERMVDLDYKLKSGEKVEIITSANQKPSFDWLSFVRTPKAYSKIKHWFNESMPDQRQNLGEIIVQREFKRFHIKKEQVNLNGVAAYFGLSDAYELYEAIGFGRVSIKQIINKILKKTRVAEINDDDPRKFFLNKTQNSVQKILVQGLDNIRINFAQCCQPEPGERILGFVTKGNGVIIHRLDCKNILTLMEHPERNIDVQWNVEQQVNFVIRLHIVGNDRKNFLRDVGDSISQSETKIVSVELHAKGSLIQGTIIVEVNDPLHLTRVINKISKVNGVLNVERLDGTGEPTTDLTGALPPLWNKAN